MDYFSKELYYLTFITCNRANQVDISFFFFFPILWTTFKASFFFPERVWRGPVQQCICVWFLILMSFSSYCGLIAHGDAQKWILRGNSCSWQLCDNDVVMGKVLPKKSCGGLILWFGLVWAYNEFIFIIILSGI